MMTNRERYDQIFIDVLGASREALGSQYTFKDTPEWDSVAHLTLISELEDAFDIMFEAYDILHYGSYENGITLLRKYGVDI